MNSPGQAHAEACAILDQGEGLCIGAPDLPLDTASHQQATRCVVADAGERRHVLEAAAAGFATTAGCCEIAGLHKVSESFIELGMIGQELDAMDLFGTPGGGISYSDGQNL